MTFFESYLCTGGKYCSVCRNMEMGRRWRNLVLRLYPTDVDADFACPNDNPWKFQPRRITESDGKSKYNRVIVGGLAMEKLEVLASTFPGLPFVEAIRQSVEKLSDPVKCSRCSKNRYKANLGLMISRLDEAVRNRVYDLLGLK